MVEPKTVEEREKEAQKLKIRMTGNSKRRYGYAVKFDKFHTSNMIKIICAVIAIIIIPLELLLEKVLTDVEIPMIHNIQVAFGANPLLLDFFEVPLVLVRPVFTMLLMMFLYQTTDSLLAFKSAIITCLGYYILTVLKLLYKDGRPFWINQDVTGYRCRFDFSGPSYHLYTLVTFWAYNVIMYRMKYTDRINYALVYTLFFLLFLVGVLVVIAGLHQGTVFLYQEFMGLLYGIMVVVLALNLDS
jgi:hypothetical protein